MPSEVLLRESEAVELRDGTLVFIWRIRPDDAPHLLERLAAIAVAHGIRVFLATVRHDNWRVMRPIRRSGLPTESKVEAGVLALRVGLGGQPARDSSVGGAPA